MRGASASALFFLPIPVVDVYAKLGAARIRSTVSGVYPTICTLVCTTVPFRADSTNTGLMGGIGAQFKVSSAAMRAEYERFSAAGANPGLLSLGVSWTFR
jgi:opacity protein-like surface antigen